MNDLGYRHLLVDGYNVAFGWQLLRAVQAGAGPRAQARDALTAQLHDFHGASGLAVSLVFDGTGDQISAETPFGTDAFSVIYAPSDLGADGVIGRMVQASSQPGRLVVATADRIIQGVAGAAGAGVWTPEALQEQVTAAARQVRGVRPPRRQPWPPRMDFPDFDAPGT
ncbi:MAG: NYN domain-containing protein [Opitutales bacterium]